jgi:hypothetical protein
MSLDQLFWLLHVPALAGWAALLLPIGSAAAQRRVAIAAGTLVALGYAGLFFAGTEAAVLVRDYSLAGVGQFFDVPRLRLAGWAHYLVLDLWAGIWEHGEAERTGMSRRLLVPALLVTAMIGPAGLLLFLLLRALGRKRAPGGAAARG